MSIRFLVRKFLKIREYETIRDGINRKQVNIIKFFDRRKIDINILESDLKKLGIKQGDTLIVHCAWRWCYSLNATPTEVVECLKKQVGKNGTIMMPSYGHDKTHFDIKNTPSNAGVLSECFRKMDGVGRSLFPDFSMCAWGNHANDIISYHQNSSLAFDKYSPYRIATFDYNAKILLIGMGKSPYKITAFHLATCDTKDTFYDSIYRKQAKAIVIDYLGNIYNVFYLDKNDGVHNNNRKFKKLFKNVPQIKTSSSGLNMISFYSKDAYKVAKEYCSKGGRLYVSKKIIKA